MSIILFLFLIYIYFILNFVLKQNFIMAGRQAGRQAIRQ